MTSQEKWHFNYLLALEHEKYKENKTNQKKKKKKKERMDLPSRTGRGARRGTYAWLQGQKVPLRVWESRASQWGWIGFLGNCLLRKSCILGAEPTKMSKTIPTVSDPQDLVKQTDINRLLWICKKDHNKDMDPIVGEPRKGWWCHWENELGLGCASGYAGVAQLVNNFSQYLAFILCWAQGVLNLQLL